jgi:hypothetical protein
VSFLSPSRPKPQEAPVAPVRNSDRSQQQAEEDRRRLSSYGQSLRASSLLGGGGGTPRSSDSPSVSRILGGGSL